MNIDVKYMQRALQLARKGSPFSFPNPMVGAVITSPDGTILGEGYHRKCGDAHAEVNAIASVKDQTALKEATMYVTLEPCAHHGRTGPCAQLIIDKGIPNVVVGTRDPFEQVNGRGIEMLREAGVNVKVGVLAEECRRLNVAFFTAHTLHRPLVTLKWAQSADGWMDTARSLGEPPEKISCLMSSMTTHHMRAINEGILVGSNTVLEDDPMLDNRLWPGPSPRPIILDRRQRVTSMSRVMKRDPLIISEDKPLEQILHDLYKQGITSILVEGGPTVLKSFIDSGLWDRARVEIGPVKFGEFGRARAPQIADYHWMQHHDYDGHLVKYFSKNAFDEVKNI